MSDNLTTVTLTLGDNSLTLRPTLAAKKAIGRYAGGYSALFRLLSGFDLDAIAFVIASGAGAKGRAATAIEDAVYGVGGEAVLAPAVRFVRICFSGGRDPDAIADAPEANGTTLNKADPAADSSTGDSDRPQEDGAADDAMSTNESTAA